jgi:four helix bundle protein
MMEESHARSRREDEGLSERKNINRGFKKLRVWQDAVSLYVMASRVFTGFPYGLKKVASNAMDAAHSISRNIAEGYCRRSIREYLNHLNIALGSCGEFHSSCEAFLAAGQLGKEEYEEIDTLHYKVENALLSLIRSLQRKEKAGEWEDRFETD